MATAGKRRGSDKAGMVRPQVLTPDGGSVHDQVAVDPPAGEDDASVNQTNAEELAEPQDSSRVSRSTAVQEMARAYKPHPDADLVKNYPKKRG